MANERLRGGLNIIVVGAAANTNYASFAQRPVHHGVPHVASTASAAGTGQGLCLVQCRSCSAAWTNSAVTREIVNVSDYPKEEVLMLRIDVKHLN